MLMGSSTTELHAPPDEGKHHVKDLVVYFYSGVISREWLVCTYPFFTREGKKLRSRSALRSIDLPFAKRTGGVYFPSKSLRSCTWPHPHKSQ